MPADVLSLAQVRTDRAESVRDRHDADRPASSAARVETLLVNTVEAAKITGISVASWHRLKAAGKTPGPVRLGGRVLYRVEDLRFWVAIGCPDRKVFEARIAAEIGNARPRLASR
jgi:predicted DNA-binding transcriptional regulator AlpA